MQGEVRYAKHQAVWLLSGTGYHMSSATLEKLRLEALRLSDRERAELAHELVKSLDGPVDSDATEAWEREILRRLAEIDSGTAALVDREELRRRMRARISGK
jgi:putative addiction module component (TIGR02574 family)